VKKSFLNLLVDTLSLFVFVALTSTGLILEWKLPPGSGRVVGPEGPDHPLTMLWGWDRHEWGDLHFVLGVLFLAVLSTHVALHWQWIKSMVTRRRRDRPAEPRAIVGLMGLSLFVLALAMPLLSRPQTLTRGQVQAQRGGTEEDGGKVDSALPGQALYEESCLGCHSQPQKIIPLDLSWSEERLRTTPPAQGHQRLKGEELRQVFEYVRAAQLTPNPGE